MDVSSREKKMIGLGMIAAAGIIVFFLAMPEFDKIQSSLGKQQTLDTDIQALTFREQALNAEVAALTASGGAGNFETGARIKTVTSDKRDATVKELLDQVIKQATTQGNKLVELKPDEEFGMMDDNQQQLQQTALMKLNTDPTLETFSAPEKRALVTADPTNLTEEQKAGYDQAVEFVRNNPLPYEAHYQLAVRGTFGSLENFLQGVQDMDDVVEFRDVALLNEAGADRSGTEPAIQQAQDVLFDPAKPIRLTTKMTIYLDVR